MAPYLIIAEMTQAASRTAQVHAALYRPGPPLGSPAALAYALADA